MGTAPPASGSGGRCRDVLFTDLDGTLLDHHTYLPGPALPALRRLRQAGVLVLPATAKTLDEVRQIGTELDLTDGAIVENGAALALPAKFPDHMPGDAADELIVLGQPYALVREALAGAAAQAGAKVRGYGDMTADEVAAETGLSPAEAVRARSRQWSETFLVTEGDPAAVAAALRQRGLRAVRGARFLTAMGDHDKGMAARLVLQRLRRHPSVRPGPGREGGELRSWAVGDAANDTELLAAVDHPLLVRAGHGEWADLDLPGLVRLDGVGPAGWALIPSLIETNR
jgi:mannosyl-3-phosphoglycerate phosphatase